MSVGERRLEAFRRLGRDEIPANVVDNLAELSAYLKAEADENTCRKDLSHIEYAAVGAAIEKAFRPVAEAAKEEGRKKGASKGG